MRAEEPANDSIDVRGTRAALYALGVLDPASDAALEAVARLTDRLGGGATGIWLCDADGWHHAAGTLGDGGRSRSAPPELAGGEVRAEIRLGGLVVGEVRADGATASVVEHAAAEVAEVLAGRWAGLRRGDLGEPVGVILVDQDLQVLWCSPEVAEFHPSATSVIGRSALEIVSPEEVETTAHLLDRGMQGRGRTGTIPVSLVFGGEQGGTFDVQGHNLFADPGVGGYAFVMRPAFETGGEHALLGDQMWVLNRLASGRPVQEVLARIIDMVEHRDPASVACIMAVDGQSGRLSPMLAPRLPAPVAAALTDLAVGPDEPAGGASLHFDVVQYTADIGRAEAWSKLSDVFGDHGIRACWSMPIRGVAGESQLGSLDVYRSVPGNPSRTDTRALIMAARLASLAIENEARERELLYQATHDPLTDLPNRFLFAERLREASAEGQVGVLFVDLDRFKLVNDTLGHEFGDEVLRAVARRLEEVLDGAALVARFGGDEFTVLVPEVEAAQHLLELGAGLLSAIGDPYVVRGQRVVLGASAGAALARGRVDDPQALVRDADTALYRAKDLGRGRIELFDERLLQLGAERVRVERALRDALDAGRIEVHFQPVIRVDDRSVVGAEALARCRTQDGELLPPAVFIAVAEEVGLISRVFDAVLRAACAATLEWNTGRDEPFVVWVNLSPGQLGSPSLVDEIRAAVECCGAQPWMLGFEVTENGILPDPEEAAARLRAIAGLGSCLAIDDFGTGYSSLGHLQGLPVDTVKLDRSFVVRAGDDPRARAIVGSVVDLTRAMGLRCVAEGVETPEQFGVVTGLGCELVQGFLFSRPVPAAELTAWMASR